MYDSRLTLDEAIRHISIFNPIKVTFNNLVLYNDYDSEVEIGDKVYGETAPMICLVPDRIKNFKDVIVTSMDIEIVAFHHSIVNIYGEQEKVININFT